MDKSNTDIFREIARRCTIDVAISLSGGELVNGRGNVVNDAKTGKCYRSPLRVDRKPSFSFYDGPNGWIKWKDFGTGKSGDLIHLVAMGRGILRPEAAKLIDQEMRLNLWTEPRPKPTENLILNQEQKQTEIWRASRSRWDWPATMNGSGTNRCLK